MMRMMKTCEHMEKKQKSASTKLLRKGRAWLIRREKGLQGYSLLSQVGEVSEARTDKVL